MALSWPCLDDATDCNKKSTGSFLCVLCGAPAKDMFGNPHGTFGIPSPLFRVGADVWRRKYLYFTVEELLKHGTPLALLACIEGTLFAATDGLSNLVLVGHSFGISVAHQLSSHLERQGVRVFGIVALDLRHTSTSVPPVPTSLADFAMARSHFHLTVSTLDLSTGPSACPEACFGRRAKCHSQLVAN
eukprot:symbB.v1.2.040629.t1/scaffold7389.1/size11536/1